MNLDLGNLDFSDLGSWPLVGKIVVITVLCIFVLGAGIWYDTREQIGELDRHQAKERELKQTFERKQSKAANLNAYKKQLAEMKRSFGTMLKQLPSKTEVAELLVDISQTGLASGLEFELFKPSPEHPVDFYAELPIQLRVTGDFHEFGSFVSGVAALPRIVTLHDFKIMRDNKQGAGGGLIMEATAKTYRYLDESEQEAAAEKESGKKKK